jgi:arsenate reductase (thioredoxin)
MNSTVLFLCPHGAAKSVIAAAYFNRLAQQHGLPLVGDAAGTEPDATVAPAVAAMMHSEGIDVSQHQPRRVTHDELRSARHIVSMGCELRELEVAPERVEQWLDVPFVSKDLYGARDAIRAHVEDLIKRIQGEPS